MAYTAMRAWRSPGGIVVEAGRSPAGLDSGMMHELQDGPWKERQEYLLLTPEGSIARAFTVNSGAIDDEMYALVYAVVDGELSEMYVAAHFGVKIRITRRVEVLVSGLRELGAGDPETALAARALELYRQGLSREAGRGSTGGVDVEAVHAAAAEPGMGREYREVLRRFLQQPEGLPGPLGSEMLEMLTRLAMACRAVLGTTGLAAEVPALLRSVVDAVVQASRLYLGPHFSSQEVPPTPRSDLPPGLLAGVPATAGEEVRGWVQSLATLERQLVEGADEAARCGGDHWAAGLRNTAVLLAWARETLEAALARSV